MYFPVDLDNGEALKKLFTTEKKNSLEIIFLKCWWLMLQAVMFDGCSIPVLIGYPVSGKSTALMAVLSVFGNCQLLNSKLTLNFLSWQLKKRHPTCMWPSSIISSKGFPFQYYLIFALPPRFLTARVSLGSPLWFAVFFIYLCDFPAFSPYHRKDSETLYVSSCCDNRTRMHSATKW